MKKNKVFMLLLALTVAVVFCLTSATAVFAESSSIQSARLSSHALKGVVALPPSGGTVDLSSDLSDPTQFVYSSSGPASGYYVYFKVTPAKAGLLTLYIIGDGYTTLCNSKYKPISARTAYSYSGGTTSDYRNYTRYGVDKGKTYYIKAEITNAAYDSSYGVYYTSAAYTNEQYTGKFGKKKSKAKAIKSGKVRKGYTVPGKASKWYKVTTKSTYVKFTFNAVSNAGLKATITYKVFGKNKKAVLKLNRANGEEIAKTYTVTLTRPAKVKYYIQVQNMSKKSCGAYTLEWN